MSYLGFLTLGVLYLLVLQVFRLFVFLRIVYLYANLFSTLKKLELNSGFSIHRNTLTSFLWRAPDKNQNTTPHAHPDTALSHHQLRGVTSVSSNNPHPFVNHVREPPQTREKNVAPQVYSSPEPSLMNRKIAEN